MSEARVVLGDCRAVLPTLGAGSFDLVFTDPPYPEISRPYGRWTEAEWFELMRAVVPEVRRVLKPTGSAVFILQPNSERLGRMRPWLWDFLSWLCREWNVVQDAWWWNVAAMPEAHAIQGGLLRPSLKACVWLGSPDCYRAQARVLWAEADRTATDRRVGRLLRANPSGHHHDFGRMKEAIARRGGVTPFNVLPLPNTESTASAGAWGHGAGTPLALTSWWVRYLCPPGGAVLDPFCGSGTTGVAALRHGASFVGVEKEAPYVDIARKRLAEARGPLFAQGVTA